MDQYDVLVVGAGLAGLQCAAMLGKERLRVLLIDRKSSIDRSVQTTGIFVRRTLEDFNLPRDCLGSPIRQVSLYSPERRRMVLRSPHDQFRIGRMSRLYNHYLSECLSLGVEWFPSTRFVRSRALRHGSLVDMKTEGRGRRVLVRYIVGADGAASRVASDLALDTNSRWIVGLEEVLRLVSPNRPPELHCFLDPTIAPGYIAWVAHDDEEIHVGVGGYPSRFNPLRSLERFRASLTDIVDLRGAEFIDQRAGRIPVGGILAHIGNRRGLLVGDAAGAVSPLTAGGLDACMRLSRFAAQVIHRYLNSDDPSVLSAYTGDRFRSRYVSRRWMRSILASVQHPFAMELACRVLRLPPFQSLAAHVFFGRGSFPDAPATEVRKAMRVTP